MIKRKKTGMTVHRRIYPRLLAAIFIIVLTAVIAISLFVHYYLESDSVVMRVNGEPVTSKEFKMFMMDNYAETYNYFKSKYGAEDSAVFWESNFKGETPIEYIKNKTKENVVRIKLKQILCKQQGLIEDISYNSYIESLKKENESREKKVKKGQIIYGPVQYGALEFFNYTLSNLETNLMTKLSQKELAVQEEVLKQQYEQNKERDYKIPDILNLQIFSISYKGDKDSWGRQEAWVVANEIKSSLERGADLQTVSKQYESRSGIKIERNELKVDESWMKTGQEIYGTLWDEMLKMSQGEVGMVKEEMNLFRVVKCIDKKDAGYEPFQEVKDHLKSKFQSEKLDEILNEMKINAKIEIIEKNYCKLTVR